MKDRIDKLQSLFTAINIYNKALAKEKQAKVNQLLETNFKENEE